MDILSDVQVTAVTLDGGSRFSRSRPDPWTRSVACRCRCGGEQAVLDRYPTGAGSWHERDGQSSDALQGIDSIWDVLYPEEQRRVLGPLIEQIKVFLYHVAVRLRSNGVSTTLAAQADRQLQFRGSTVFSVLNCAVYKIARRESLGLFTSALRCEFTAGWPGHPDLRASRGVRQCVPGAPSGSTGGSGSPRSSAA